MIVVLGDSHQAAGSINFEGRFTTDSFVRFALRSNDEIKFTEEHGWLVDVYGNRFYSEKDLQHFYDNIATLDDPTNDVLIHSTEHEALSLLRLIYQSVNVFDEHWTDHLSSLSHYQSKIISPFEAERLARKYMSLI